MTLIKPLRPNVIDPITGQFYPPKGAERAVLQPRDYVQERTGDVEFVSPKNPAEATVIPAAEASKDKAKR
jgi:hypothetical protein